MPLRHELINLEPQDILSALEDTVERGLRTTAEADDLDDVLDREYPALSELAEAIEEVLIHLGHSDDEAKIGAFGATLAIHALKERGECELFEPSEFSPLDDSFEDT